MADDLPWNAAWLRNGPAGGLELSVDGFVRDMRRAFPGHVRVERAGFALLPGRRRIVKAAIDTASGVYLLRAGDDQLTAERLDPVPGAAPRSQPMDLPAWLGALHREIVHPAEPRAAPRRGLALRRVGVALVAMSCALGAAAFTAAMFFDQDSAEADFLFGAGLALLISGWQGYRLCFGRFAAQTARRSVVVWAMCYAILCAVCLADAFREFSTGMPLTREEPALLATLAFAFLPVSTLGSRFRDLYLCGYLGFFVAVFAWLAAPDALVLQHASMANWLGLIGIVVPLALLCVTSEPARVLELLVLMLGAAGGAAYWIVSMMPGSTDGSALFATYCVMNIVAMYLTGGDFSRRYLIVLGRAFIACLFGFGGVAAAALGLAAYWTARSWFAASADNSNIIAALAVTLCFVPFWVLRAAPKLRAMSREFGLG